jgi:hypothetical protein
MVELTEVGKHTVDIRYNQRKTYPEICKILKLALKTISAAIKKHEGRGRKEEEGKQAENGEILYSKQLMRSFLARGNIYLQDGSQARKVTEFPCALSDYDLTIPSDLPTDFPDQWVDTDSTVGKRSLLDT